MPKVNVNNTGDPPPWNKDYPPYNALAYLIDKEKVVKGMKPQKVHELLPLFTQYDLTRFRNNYNSMLKKYRAGTLVYSVRVIPANIMKMLKDGSYANNWSEKTQAGLNEQFEGTLISHQL